MITYAFFVIFMIFFSGITVGPDLEIYKMNYFYAEKYSIYGFEPLYQYMVIFVKSLGLEFEEFYALYAFIGLTLIFEAYKKYTKNVNLIWILYFIYPFSMDVVQIRSFMSIAIVFWALHFLSYDNRKRGIILYSFFVILAAMFHISSLIFLIVDIIFLINNKYVVGGTLAFSVAFYFFIKQISLFTPFLPVLVTRKLNYLEVGVENRTVIILLLYFFVSTIFFTWLGGRKMQDGIITEKKKIMINIFVKLNYLAILLFPVFICQISFLRLHRLIVLGNYVLIADYNEARKDKHIARLLGIIYTVITFIAFIGLYNWDSVVRPLFESNKWFRW